MRDRDYEYDNEGRTDYHYIPQDILENLPPKYRAMMYKGRDVMEANDQANNERNIGSTKSRDNDGGDDNESRQLSR